MKNTALLVVVKNATPDYSEREMSAALEVNLPNYAAVLPANEVVTSMSASHGGIG